MRLRFIPAGAGNGLSVRALAYRQTVHPRRRGERSDSSTSAARFSGSSPQARGTGRSGDGSGLPGRFIPAGAGKGTGHRDDPAPPPVHPRRRGERVDAERAAGVPVGSSPQARGTGAWSSRDREVRRFIPAARGTAARDLDQVEVGRFIPAGAGNGASRGRSTRRTTVHPRRARGTVPAVGQRGAAGRFIPAGAGNGC